MEHMGTHRQESCLLNQVFHIGAYLLVSPALGACCTRADPSPIDELHPPA